MAPFMIAASAAPLERVHGPSMHDVAAHEALREPSDCLTFPGIRSREFASITAYGLHVYNLRPARFGSERLADEDVRRASEVIRSSFGTAVSDCGSETDAVAARAVRAARTVVMVCPATPEVAKLAAGKILDMGEMGVVSGAGCCGGK